MVITDHDINIAYKSLPITSNREKVIIKKFKTRTPLQSFEYPGKLRMIIVTPKTDIRSV
jgi:hypothetical protein